MIRLIACDLDGTLLTKEGRLPEGIFPMIRALREKGIRFAPASGRQCGNLRRLFAPEAADMDFIAENGAFVSAGGRETASWFPRETAEEIMADILDSGMELLISAPETCYVLGSADRAYTDDIVYRLRNTVTVIDDYRDAAERTIKLSGYHPQGVAAMAPALQAKWGGRLHCDVAGRDWLDFTLANKGTGLMALSDALRIPLRDIAAFGDQFNDDSMLAVAGHPFIMAHAPAPLLEKGYALCGNVMETLEKILRDR